MRTAANLLVLLGGAAAMAAGYVLLGGWASAFVCLGCYGAGGLVRILTFPMLVRARH